MENVQFNVYYCRCAATINKSTLFFGFFPPKFYLFTSEYYNYDGDDWWAPGTKHIIIKRSIINGVWRGMIPNYSEISLRKWLQTSDRDGFSAIPLAQTTQLTMSNSVYYLNWTDDGLNCPIIITIFISFLLSAATRVLTRVAWVDVVRVIHSGSNVQVHNNIYTWCLMAGI